MDTTKNYAKFVKYLKSYINRDGIDRLINWLNESDMAIAPASTKYHMSEPGGLVQHSLNVFYRLINIINMEYPNQDDCPYSKETLALVALLHDISKVNFYEISSRNVKNPDTGVWEQVPYFAVRDESNRLIFGYHEENSLFILQNFVKLSYDEAMAIRWHGGACSSDDHRIAGESMNAFRHSRLALYLHMADMMAANIDEAFDVTNVDYFKEGIVNEQDSEGTTSETDDVLF